MTAQDYFSLMPFILVLSTIALVMLTIAWQRNHKLVSFVSISGIFSAFLTTLNTNYSSTLKLIIINSYNLMLIQGVLITSLVIIIFTFEYIKYKNQEPEEFYVLILLSILGALVVVVSNHFVSLFLGIELLTIPLYCAIAYNFSNKNIEAATKYIILAGLAAALMLFGMALVYADSGAMDFATLAYYPQSSSLFVCGMALILVALAFKISAVPFHVWTPDVYDGAPLCTGVFLATISKGVSLIILMRIWLLLEEQAHVNLFWLMSIISILSMLGGNILALKQDNIKRLLAYSSIAHFGYLTMAMIATAGITTQAILLYLLSYIITILIIFGVLMTLNRPVENIAELKGLFSEQPFFALALFLGFLSLMGLPLTALFMAKFLVIMAGVKSSQWLLISALVTSSALGIFVYIRITNILFEKSSSQNMPKNIKPLASSVVALLALCLLVLGLWPTPATSYIRQNNTAMLTQQD